jgi:hypothetical protein
MHEGKNQHREEEQCRDSNKQTTKNHGEHFFTLDIGIKRVPNFSTTSRAVMRTQVLFWGVRSTASHTPTNGYNDYGIGAFWIKDVSCFPLSVFVHGDVMVISL